MSAQGGKEVAEDLQETRKSVFMMKRREVQSRDLKHGQSSWGQVVDLSKSKMSHISKRGEEPKQEETLSVPPSPLVWSHHRALPVTGEQRTS